MTDYGILSLLPVAVVIVLVFFTKRTAVSLLVGTLVGAVMPLRNRVCQTLVGCGLRRYGQRPPDLVGAGLWVFRQPGGACSKPPAGSMASPPSRPRFAREKNGPWWPVGSLGIVTFVDDWLSILSVGTAMRRATDRFHIPREMLAFLSNATATSICVIVPTSTWGVFMISQLVATDVCTSEAGMSTFVQVLPFLFYPLVALLCGFLYSVGILPKLVPCAKPTPWPRSRQLL